MKEWRAKRFAPGVKMGRPRGATSGFSAAQRKQIIAKASAEAEKIMEHLVETKQFNIPKEEYAYDAMKEAITMVRRTDLAPKDKATYVKTVLEYTMAKPATETTVNVKTAEDFLADVAKDAGIE